MCFQFLPKSDLAKMPQKGQATLNKLTKATTVFDWFILTKNICVDIDLFDNRVDLVDVAAIQIVTGICVGIALTNTIVSLDSRG